MNVRVRSLGLAALVVVLMGMARSFGAKMLVMGLKTEAQAPPPRRLSPEDIRRQVEADQQKPRFLGEINGIFIGPSESDWPTEDRQRRQKLIAGGCTSETIQRAGALDFPREPLLAPEYVLSASSPEVVACSGIVSGVNREYVTTAANGLPANLLIARSIARAWDFSVAADRVSARSIGGRDVVVISPIGDGTGQTSQVLFREAFGVTVVSAFNLSEAELLQVVAAVADASK